MDFFAEVCCLITKPFGNRGYWRLLQLAPGRGRRLKRVDRAEILYDARDNYWAVLRANSFEYEPEIKAALYRFSRFDLGFVDAGANIGYWSSWVQRELQVHRIVAIEPNPEVFSLLQLNNLLNGGNAVCLQSALTAKNIDSFMLHVPKVSGGHASGSAFFTANSRAIRVSTETLRSIVQTHMKDVQLIIIKLDVEGLESELLQEIAESRDQRQIIIYEDHGSDRDCKATQVALGIPGYLVFFLEKNGNWIPIQAAHEIQAFKRNISMGYNCIAVPRSLASHVLKLG